MRFLEKRTMICRHRIAFLYPLLVGVLVLVCQSPFAARAGGAAAADWGTTAIRLKPAYAGALSAAALTADDRSSVVLTHFYRAGGNPVPATPTGCRIAYDAQALLVAFRCSETNMAFPARTHETNYFAKFHSPSERDACFPDHVSLFLLPDFSQPDAYYQFTATIDGLKFGTRYHGRTEPAPSDEPAPAPIQSSRLDKFEATVSREQNGWTVVFRIPWETLGGKPAACFGLIPMRIRWRDGEVSSPVAMNFGERPPTDLFIETYFSQDIPLPRADTTLCRLPSGSLRWQRPAQLVHPGPETLQDIWRMQRTLEHPTNRRTLAERVNLTQHWLDLLVLEGFNFEPTSGSIAREDLRSHLIRRQVNAALRSNQVDQACQLLDGYLRKLSAVSSQWFADGSPGDIAAGEWRNISKLKSIETNGAIVVLHCLAGDKVADLHLSLSKSGGLRLYGSNEGYFKPTDLEPLRLTRARHGSWSAVTSEGTILIQEKPLQIVYEDANRTNSPHPGLPKGEGERKAALQIDLAKVAFRFGPQDRILAVDFQHRLEPDEIIFGFGEKYDRFNQNGNVLTLWGMDDWTGLTIGLENASYKPVPLFHSSKGYTVFINSSYRLRADVGQGRSDRFRLTQHGPIFDYYFRIGSPEKALRSYTELTGKPCLPPKWAFEPWMGRTGRGWANNPQQDPVAEQERVVERFAALDIPHSALYAEGSGAESPALHAFMATRGLKVLSWYYSSISPAQQKALMPDTRVADLPLLNAGSVSGTSLDPEYVDFTHPNALDLSRRWWAKRLGLGVAGSMVDFGDRVPEDAVFFDGRKGDEMHNFYSYGYHRTYQQVFHEKRGDDFILFGRAAAPGTQRWVAQFGGDHPANFMGLRAVLTGALNLSACGFSTWGSDLGGFLGWPEPEVYLRWTQFACFSPLMRAHGRTPREPWEFGEDAVANYKYYAWVRENLLDYIYQAAVTAHETGVPIMRSMAVAFPREPALAAVSDQYMFGPDLLVAPMVAEGHSRMIGFPPGKWTSLWDGAVIAGPARVNIPVAADLIPVFLRPGAMVPVQLANNLQLGQSMTRGRVNALLVAAPETPSAGSNSFSVSLQQFRETRYLIIYEPAVEQVKTDGTTLPRLEEKGTPDRTGWRMEPANGRTVICLPQEAVRSIEIRTRL